MQAEKEFVQNFCPRCYIQLKGEPIYCTQCGSFDLIPNPSNIKSELTYKEETAIEDAINEAEFTRQEEPIPEIDPKILEQLQKPFAFITGRAGTGKTTLTRLMASLYPNYIELCSTTGIAAINLGGRTINSILKYYNTKSLRNNYEADKLQWALRKIRLRKQNLGIEEVSMLDAEQMNLIMAAIDEINGDRSGRSLGLHIIGDLCQLPPVNAPFVFKSKYWNRFAENTIHLEKVWRQDNPDFVAAINLVREGKGSEAVAALNQCGVRFKEQINNNFEGTTLIPLNDGVDAYNTKRLMLNKNPMIRTVSQRFGIPMNEWDRLVPIELRVKIGEYVMILNNEVRNFDYVNGDCGTIEEYDAKEDKFHIRLVRTGGIVKVGRLKREHLSDKNPGHNNFKSNFHPYIDSKTNDWVIGVISYHPIRLAWATSVHKSQGLSLDKIQIDTSKDFFGYPAMAYVAISRCRTPEGLILVGKPADIAKKIRTNPEVMKYV